MLGIFLRVTSITKEMLDADFNNLYASIKKNQAKNIDNLLTFTNNNGDTLLHAAIKRLDEYTAQSLIDKHIDVNVCNEKGYTPLHIAILELKKIYKVDKPSILYCIIKTTYYENLLYDEYKDCNNGSAEMVAKCLRLMSMLLSKNANPDARDKYGNAIIHYAAKFDLVKTVSQAIDLTKTDINSYNKNNDTPIRIAISEHNMESIASLIKLGSKLYLTPKNKKDLEKLLSKHNFLNSETDLKQTLNLMYALKYCIDSKQAAPWELNLLLKIYQKHIEPYLNSIQKPPIILTAITTTKNLDHEINSHQQEIVNIKKFIDGFIVNNLFKITTVSKEFKESILPKEIYTKHIFLHLSLNDINLNSKIKEQGTDFSKDSELLKDLKFDMLIGDCSENHIYF